MISAEIPLTNPPYSTHPNPVAKLSHRENSHKCGPQRTAFILNMFGRKNNPATITEQAVKNVLATVIDPERNSDLISLNMVRNIAVADNNVTITLVMSSPSYPFKTELRDKIDETLRRVFPSVGKLSVNWNANVGQQRPQVTAPDSSAPAFKSTIAVASGKGGVGKSTVSVNLAIALAKTGARVGLLDADILGPNVPMMMGVEKLPPVRERKMVPAENYGVKFISTAFLMKPDQALVWRGPMLNSAIRQFLTDVMWDELDYLIVDLPPGTGDAPLSLAQALPLSGAVIVTQPMAVAAGDARRAIKMFESLKVPVLGVVENMSGELFGTGAGKKLAEMHELDYFGEIPLDMRVRIGGDEGKPIVAATPTAPASQAFFSLAEQVAERVTHLTQLGHGGSIPIEMVG